jgi:hypothetical protein
MSRLEGAMFKHIEQIVLRQSRAFCSVDFRPFEYDGEKYNPAYGTVRNTLCKFKKKHLIKFQFLSGNAYYSLPGHNFTKEVTLDRVGVSLNIGRQTPLYKWLKNRPREKQSLHDIRLTFTAKGFWNTVCQKFSEKVNLINQDIKLDSLRFTEDKDIIIKITVHHTNTVSVAIACSNRPIVIDVPDILYLIEILTRVETKLAAFCGTSVAIPRYTMWIVKMWHFGFDFLDWYDGEKFQVTFEEGISDLWRIYTKRWKNGKVKPRVEHQENPNKPIIDALLDKLYEDGEIR